MFRRASALACALATAVAAAQAPPAGAPANRATAATLRGPIKITAERAELERQDYALYRGNVRLTSPEVELAGDRLELRQPSKGQFEARLTGRPARLKHKAAGGAPPVAASAPEIHYDTRRATVDLMGGAQLERGTDLVKSETIRYDLTARRISASGVGEGQVQIIIQPPAPPARAEPDAPQNTPPPVRESEAR